MISSTDPNRTDDGYFRPHRNWECGHACSGDPCPLGPSRWGVCRDSNDCQPVMRDDRWQCNRSPVFGGPCEQGPGIDGTCGRHRVECAPIPSQRKRRRAFILWCCAVTVGLMSVVINRPNWMEFVAPGELSSPHARLLNGTTHNNRCAACHELAHRGVGDWISAALLGKPDQTVTQSELCLKCHAAMFDARFAMLDHTTDPDRLRGSVESTHQLPTPRLSLQPAVPKGPHGAIACATCHREHHGANHNLSELTNHQCANCHTRRFHRFSDHPEFDAWPTAKSAIAFDHAMHQAKYFPQHHASFDCRACHVDANGLDIRSSLGYAACARCHDDKITGDVSDGIQFFALPMVDRKLLQKHGIEIGPWPETATGDFDGPLPAVMRLMLETDPTVRDALAMLGANADFADIDPDDAEQVRHAGTLVRSIQKLLGDLADVDHVANRLRTAFPGASAASQREFVSPFSPFIFETAHIRWFAESSWALPPANTSDNRATGWVRDDETFSILYRPRQHADFVVKSLLDLAVSRRADVQPESVTRVFDELSRPTAPGQCLTCHRIKTDNHVLAIAWEAEQDISERSFTKFSHRPHIIQPELRDCSHCHQRHAGGFARIKMHTCAACHTPTAAGDSCLKCHNYHVGSHGLTRDVRN